MGLYCQYRAISPFNLTENHGVAAKTFPKLPVYIIIPKLPVEIDASTLLFIATHAWS